MKKLIFLIVFVTSFSHAVKVFHGDIAYDISNISSELSKKYGSQLIITTVLVASISKENELFKKQWSLLDEVDAEGYQIIYVSALAEANTNNHGYHTTTKTAKQILSGKGFVVQIYSATGELLASSDIALSAGEIVEYISKPATRAKE